MRAASGRRGRSRSYRVEILHPGGGEGLGHLGGRDHAGHRVSVSNRLPHGDDVGDEVGALQLEGPEMAADAAEAHLDLIGDDDASGPAHVSAGEGSEVTASTSLLGSPPSLKIKAFQTSLPCISLDATE